MKNTSVHDYYTKIKWILKNYNGLYFIFCNFLLWIHHIYELAIAKKIGEIIQYISYHTYTNEWKYVSLLIISAVSFKVLYIYYSIKIKEMPGYCVRRKTMQVIFNLGFPFYEQRGNDTLLMLFSSIIPAIENLYSRIIPEIMQNLCVTVISFIFFIGVNGWKSAIVLFLALPSGFIQKKFTKKISSMTKEQLKKEKFFYKKVVALVNSIRDMRGSHSEEWMKHQVTDSYSDYMKQRINVLDIRYKRGAFFTIAAKEAFCGME